MFAVGWVGTALASCAATCACQACGFASQEVVRRSARLAYCVLFTLALVEAWVLRDFAQPLMEKLPWILRHETEHSTEAFYGQQAVYRVSIGNAAFFGLMALTMLGVRYKNDKRDLYLQHGGWLVKVGLWLLFNALPFFLPVGVVNSYGWLARIGSGCFLCMQILMLLDFVVHWNDSWVDMDDVRFLYALLAITVTAFLGSAGIVAVLFYFFNPSGPDCSFNITMIVFTILIGLVLSGVSMSTYATNGSIFPASIFTLYCTYLCYSAMVAEPHDDACNSLGHRLNAASATTLALGMGLALLSVVYSALRAGSNTALFNLGVSLGVTEGAEDESEGDRPLLDAEEKGEGDTTSTSAGLDGAPKSAARTGAYTATTAEENVPVTYNYSFFHLVFALASMYIAMLMTGWGTNPQERDLIDVGWTSVWVKLVTQWATALTYVWMLVAPAVFPDRDFSH